MGSQFSSGQWCYTFSFTFVRHRLWLYVELLFAVLFQGMGCTGMPFLGIKTFQIFKVCLFFIAPFVSNFTYSSMNQNILLPSLFSGLMIVLNLELNLVTWYCRYSFDALMLSISLYDFRYVLWLCGH